MIDEDFEEELGSPSEENCENDPESEFRDIAKYGIVQVAGTSRNIVILLTCHKNWEVNWIAIFMFILEADV